MKVRVYISCCFHCPYEGDTEPAVVLSLVQQLWRLRVDEIALADTLGKATPLQVKKLIEGCLGIVPVEHLAMHFHDSYGQGLTNIYAGLQMGISSIDASVAGLGGCPYATGASGNVATEDLLFMLNGLGIKTGVSLGKTIAVGNRVSNWLGQENLSRVSRAMR